MAPFLNRMLADVRSEILTNNLTDFGRARLNKVYSDLTAIIDTSIGKMGNALTSDLIDFGEYEAEFTQKMLDNIATLETAGINVDQISSVLTTSKMNMVSGGKVSRMTIGQAVTQLAGATARSTKHAIQTGIAQGKTTKEIAKEVSRIIKGRTKAQAEAVIRTAANHAGTQARNKLYKENADILTGEEFVATLDSRTSLECAGNDGKIFPVGKGVFPPLHFNCRSIRIPIVDPDFVIGDLQGDRPSFGASGAQKVSGQSNFSGWLRKQPASFQDDYFKQFPDGAARAKLFRNGGLSVDKFIDKKNIVYSLDELKGLEPKAFERAGLTTAKPKPKPKPIPKKAIKPIPETKGVKIRPKKEVKKLFDQELKAAAIDPRYVLASDGLPEYRFAPERRVRGVTNRELSRKTYGKYKVGAISDEAASIIYQTTNEANKLAARYGVQPLRGVKSGAGRGSAASMGDGVLNVNLTHFEKYAIKASDPKASAKLKALNIKIETAKTEIAIYRKEIDELKAAGASWGEYREVSLKLNKKIDSHNRYARQYDNAVPSVLKPSKWNVGDDLQNRPHTAKSYYSDNEDYLRSTVYHEMGHHIHQQFKVKSIADYRSPPLETVLAKLFRTKRTVTPTKYAGQDWAEWFAENFSLYHMGQTKLVDPILIQLLESMEAGKYIEFVEATI